MFNGRTLLGSGNAVVVGIPPKFDLKSALANASEIRMATAFAHMSGWNHVEPGISKCGGRVRLLTGLDFNQTDPKVLKKWLEVKLSASDRVEACLADSSTFFHPKVLIVNGDNGAHFAVVGSGNLSGGGLQTNTECAVFVEDAATIGTLVEWFDAQFEAATPLVSDMIKAYEPDYAKAKKKRAALEKSQKLTHSKLKSVGQASLANWSEALQKVERYFRSASFTKTYEGRKEGAKRILEALRAPEFDFDRNGWKEFYSVRPLGRLDERTRDRVFAKQQKLRQGLKALFDNSEAAIPKVLGRKGSLRISGFGLNTVSKILAAYQPDEWPVYNSRVADALNSFGYKAPRGTDTAGRYLAYRNTMKRFMEACKQRGLSPVNAWSLDAFFYERSKQLE